MPILWPLKVPERGDAITQRKTFQTLKSQTKEIKSSLKQNRIPVTVKPTDRTEVGLQSCTRPGTTGQCRLLYDTCDVKQHHSELLNNRKTRLFVLYLKNYAARALTILFNTRIIPPKYPYSNQATPKKYMPNCRTPQKIPESKISNPPKNPSIIPVT